MELEEWPRTGRSAPTGSAVGDVRLVNEQVCADAWAAARGRFSSSSSLEHALRVDRLDAPHRVPQATSNGIMVLV